MAIYPNDATALFTVDGFTSMVDKKPDKGFSTTQQFSTIVFKSEAGYEKRRLRSRRVERNYNLTYTNVTGLVKDSIERFYQARSGEFESFTLDLAHLSETGNVTVRFDGGLSKSHIFTSGSNLLESIHTVSFKVKEVFG